MRLLADSSERLAIVCGNVHMTYAQLAEGVADKCKLLRQADAASKRVLLDLPDSVTLLEWVIAAWQMQCCITILDQRLTELDKEERMSQFAPHVRIAAVATENRMLSFQPAVEWELQRLPSLAERECAAAEVNTQAEGGAAASKEAIVLFSSGSTAMPKAIVRNFASLAAEWSQYSLEPGAPDDTSVTYCLVPISHAFGLLSATLFTLRQGGIVLFPTSLQANELITSMQLWNVTHLYGVAFHYQLLAHGLEQLDQEELQSLQLPLMLSSGGSLPPELTDIYRNQFGQAIGQQYGMSEVGYIAVDFLANAPGSVGKPASHLKGEKRTEDGQWMIHLDFCPYVESQHNWLTEHGSASGWLLTEDQVELNEQGYLYMKGRTNDEVSIGGLKVRLQEIEQAALRHDHIEACCAVTVQHSSIGQALHLFVVWNDLGKVRASALQQWLRTYLSDYKIPKQIQTVERIPRSAAGKVLRSQLLKECSYGSTGA